MTGSNSSIAEAAGAMQAVSTAASPPTRHRKLHLGHIAFMRSVVQGLNTRESWNRYLRVEGEHDDIRNVRRTIQWIRDEFAAAAKRHDRFGTARLVKLDAGQLEDTKSLAPSLEEFAADYDLLDFSQAEQVEQYEARYGAITKRQSRRKRLIEKQLEALNWLERQVAQPPRSGDAIASWLHPDLVARLEAAGIFTVRQLIDRINGLGMRWWTGIRAIGAAKAERITEWLRTHEASIGLAIGSHVNVKRSALDGRTLHRLVPRTTAIVPIEKLVVPQDLDGSAGLYRAPQQLCLLTARTDSEAVISWVKAKQGLSPEQKTAAESKGRADPAVADDPLEWRRYLSHTQRAYLKEAERFMLWAVLQRKKALSSMENDDCEAYCSFLTDPSPAEVWCGPRGREKWGPLWRPFEGPLSPQARRHAITILKNLYRFLVDQRYLAGNPWDGVALPKIAQARISKARGLNEVQWLFVEEQLDRLPDTSANRRLNFAVQLFCATGLRLGDVVAAKTDHLKQICFAGEDKKDNSGRGWGLEIPGKGENICVPIPDNVMKQLSTYLVSRGLHSDPKHPTNGGVFLIGKAVDVASRAPWSPKSTLLVDSKAGVAAGTLYSQMKDFLAGCADKLATTDPKGAHRMAAASTEWLRYAHRSSSDSV